MAENDNFPTYWLLGDDLSDYDDELVGLDLEDQLEVLLDRS